MKKNIWILNHYATSHFEEKGGRHYWLSKQLKKKGYLPTVFGASVLHNDEKQINLDGQIYKIIPTDIEVPFVVIKVRPERNNGVQRIKNMYDFYHHIQIAAKKYAEKNGKPDVIYASSVHPLTLIAGEKIAKKFKVPCICEVRDLWPEEMILMGIWKKNLITRAMYIGENWIYRKADALICTMEGFPDYIKNRKWDLASGGKIDLKKIYHINNGVDLKQFWENVKLFPVADDDLSEPGKFIINYTGSIRAANNVDILVNTAKYLDDFQNDRVKILIWGAGDYSEKLCASINKLGLKNIVYKGSVKKKYIPSILVQGDMNVYTFRDGGTKWGASLNKSFEYMASGKPIVGNIDTPYSIVEKFECGVEKKMDAFELAEVMDKMSKMPKIQYQFLCDNAKNAVEKYDFSVLAEKVISVVENV